jgi:hypothetical protein
MPGGENQNLHKQVEGRTTLEKFAGDQPNMSRDRAALG